MTAAMPVSARPFNTVADTQAVFRAILDAMARPGTRQLLPVVDGNAPLAGTGPLLALAQTLLDHEVTFAVVPGCGERAESDAERVATYLTLVTGSRAVGAVDAGYVFALGPLPPGLPAMLRAGNPAYPDESATLVVLSPLFNGESGVPVSLTGPGIAGRTALTLPGLTPSDLANLAAANAEPPLGVDVILVDPGGTVVCLPRSTRVRLGDAIRCGKGLPASTTAPREEPDGLHRG